MTVHVYGSAAEFLAATTAFLEEAEAANGLILGLGQRLVDHPDRYQAAPFLAMVEGEEGPLLVALMTPPHNLILSDTPADHRPAAYGQLARLQDRLLADGWSLPGFLGPAEAAGHFARSWVARTGGTCQIERHQRLHELREVLLPKPETGQVRLAGPSDAGLLGGWMQAFKQETIGENDFRGAQALAEWGIGDGTIYLWHDGRPVSMAMKTRPTRRGISVGYVYTPPEYRRRGYATACVAELSRLLLDSGRDFCALYTDLANPTSNHIYWEIGYRPICDVDQYRFS